MVVLDVGLLFKASRYDGDVSLLSSARNRAKRMVRVISGIRSRSAIVASLLTVRGTLVGYVGHVRRLARP